MAIVFVFVFVLAFGFAFVFVFVFVFILLLVSHFMTSPGSGNNKAMTFLAIATRDTHTSVDVARNNCESYCCSGESKSK